VNHEVVAVGGEILHLVFKIGRDLMLVWYCPQPLALPEEGPA